jgi:hypothetical protein
MKENKVLKLIQEKLDYYYLKAEYTKTTVGHVFVAEGLHIIVNDEEECKCIEFNSFDKGPKIRKVCKDEETLVKELDKTLLAFYKIKHNRINEENKSKPVRSSFINKQLYRLYLFAFDMWGKRIKKGKRAGIWKILMDDVWADIYDRTDIDERWKIYNELNPKKSK